MKRKRIFLLSGVIVLVSLLGLGSIIQAETDVPKKEIGIEFDRIKENMDNIKVTTDKNGLEVPLVQGSDFTISKKRFAFYKNNIEMIKKLNGDGSATEDSTLINDMIKKELAYSYAKSIGLSVSTEEVNNIIDKERMAVDDPNDTDKNNETVKEIMKNRIRISGYSEDEFWKSNDIQKEYEKSILLGKLYNYLKSKGQISNVGDFNSFQETLLTKEKSDIIINSSSLK